MLQNGEARNRDSATSSELMSQADRLNNLVKVNLESDLKKAS